MPDIRTFKATPAALQSLATLLASHGVAYDPNEATGSVTEGGWAITWRPGASPETIEIAVSKHPFAELGIFWSKLADILGPAIA